MFQWLGLHTSTAGGMVWIPGQGTKILQVSVTWLNHTPTPPPPTHMLFAYRSIK